MKTKTPTNRKRQRQLRVQRVVRRMRCVTCGQLEANHIPNCLCDCDYHEEIVMLPVCIRCADRVCETDEDEICQHCWDESLWVANMTRELRIAAGWRADGAGGVHPPNTEVSDAGPVASNCNKSESRRSLD